MTDRKIPFGVTLRYCAALCAFFWVMTFLFPIYVGVAALVIGTICLAVQLAVLVRHAFTFGSRGAADFVAGKGYQPRNDAGQFASLKPAMNARLAAENAARKSAIRQDVEAK